MSFRLLLPSLFLAFSSAAQFKPDELGHVSDPKFLKHIKAEGYQLVGAFGEIKRGAHSMWVAKVMKNDNWFYTDMDGNLYANIDAVENTLDSKKEVTSASYPPEQNDSYGGVSEMIMPREAYTEKPFNGAKIHRGKKTGYVFNGKLILPPKYDGIHVTPYGDQPMILVIRKELVGLADTNGTILIPLLYDYIGRLGEKGTCFYSVEKDGRYGITDRKGNMIVALQSGKPSFNGNYFEVTAEEEKKGVYDTLGRLIVPVEFASVELYKSTDVLLVTTGEKYHDNYRVGSYDLSGRKLFPATYADYSEFSENILTIRGSQGSPSKAGLYDLKKKAFLLPVDYEMKEYSREDTILISGYVKDQTLFGAINRHGEWVYPLKYTALELRFEEKQLIAAVDGKYGLTDLSENVLIPFQYERLYPLRSSRQTANLPADQFMIKTGGRYGTINLKNETIIPATFESLAPSGFAMVTEGSSESQFYDLKGRLLTTAHFHVTGFRHGIIEGRTNRNEAVQADLYGNVVVIKTAGQ